MGGGKEKKKTNDMINQQNQTQQAEHAQDRTNIQQQQSDAAANSATSRAGANAAMGQYGSSIGAMRGTNYNVTPDFDESRGLYRNFAATGGVDENQMRGAHPVFQDQMNNTGIASNFRAGGTYDEFNRTGGVSEADKTNMRARSNSVIPAYYGAMRDEANRIGAVQGGSGAARVATMMRMGRDQASASASQARDTELGISDQVRQGRMWGATGMTGAEGAYQGMRGQAAGQLDASEANIQNTLQRGRMFGTTGINSVEGAINDTNIGNANRMLSRDSTAAGMYGNLSGQAAGMYDADRGYEATLGNQSLGERGQYYDANGNLIQNRIGNNPQYDRWGQLIGAGSALGGAAML